MLWSASALYDVTLLMLPSRMCYAQSRRSDRQEDKLVTYTWSLAQLLVKQMQSSADIRYYQESIIMDSWYYWTLDSLNYSVWQYLLLQSSCLLPVWNEKKMNRDVVKSSHALSVLRDHRQRWSPVIFAAVNFDSLHAHGTALHCSCQTKDTSLFSTSSSSSLDLDFWEHRVAWKSWIWKWMFDGRISSKEAS